MNQPGRKFAQGSSYRYGFNGQEKDKELNESMIDYKYRLFDARISRFLSVDPLENEYPCLTPYQHSSLNPIEMIELEGLEGLSSKNTFFAIGIKIQLLNFKKIEINVGANLKFPYNAENQPILPDKNMSTEVNFSSSSRLTDFNNFQVAQFSLTGSLSSDFKRNQVKIGSSTLNLTIGYDSDNGEVVLADGTIKGSYTPQEQTKVKVVRGLYTPKQSVGEVSVPMAPSVPIQIDGTKPLSTAKGLITIKAFSAAVSKQSGLVKKPVLVNNNAIIRIDAVNGTKFPAWKKPLPIINFNLPKFKVPGTQNTTSPSSPTNTNQTTPASQKSSSGDKPPGT